MHSIYQHDSTLRSNLEILKDSRFPDPAPLHDFYKEWFNLIDIGNKKWYAVADHHPNHLWKSKMLFATMRHFMTNVWVLDSLKTG